MEEILTPITADGEEANLTAVKVNVKVEGVISERELSIAEIDAEIALITASNLKQAQEHLDYWNGRISDLVELRKRIEVAAKGVTLKTAEVMTK